MVRIRSGISGFTLEFLAIVAAAALLAACSDIPEKALNISGWGSVNVSAEEWSRYNAVDGDPETWWSAQDFAPQWLAVEFENPYPVNKIELTVSQVEEGPTTHEIWFKNESRVLTLAKRLANVTTADQDTLKISINPPSTSPKCVSLLAKG